MTGYDISARADADIDEIWTYIAQRDFRAADHLSDRLVAKFEMLSRQPLIGESVGHLSPGLRCVPVGNYVIYYEIASNRVSITRVLHGSRDVSQFWGNQE